MKKFLTLILALALVLSLSVPVFAANETSARTDLSFIYADNEPSYIVTIPASLELSMGENFLPITVTDAENLNGKKITVTIEGTNEPNGIGGFATVLHVPYEILLSGYTNEVRYNIFNAEGNLIGEGGPHIFAVHDRTLAEFDGNGEKSIKISNIESVWSPPSFPIMPNVPYTGYIVFGIKVV